MSAITQKLRALLALPEWTQARVAQELGVSQSTINRWTKGTEPEGDHRDALANLYNHVHGFSQDLSLMQIRGSIGDGQRLRILDKAEQDFIAQPPSTSKTLTAARVDSDAMMPIFMRGWTIFYGDPTRVDDGVHEIVVAQLTDGSLIVRKLIRGSTPNVWTLTIPSASDIVDVEVEHIHPIEWVKPFSFGPIPF